MDDGLRRRAPGQLDQAEIVVGFTVGGIKSQDLAELFLRRIEFFLSDIQVPEIVMSPGGIGIERERMLKCLQSVVVVSLAAAGDSKQVVTLHTGGIQLQLFVYFLFGFLHRTLA